MAENEETRVGETADQKRERWAREASLDDVERKKLDTRSKALSEEGKSFLDYILHPVALGVLVLVCAGWMAFVLAWATWGEATLKLNEFGDSMAPLGVLVSGAALFYVAQGLQKQSKELELQRVELGLARLEGRAQRRATEEANLVAEERKKVELATLDAVKAQTALLRGEEGRQKQLDKAVRPAERGMARLNAWLALREAFAGGSTDEAGKPRAIFEAMWMANQARLMPTVSWNVWRNNLPESLDGDPRIDQLRRWYESFGMRASDSDNVKKRLNSKPRPPET